MTDSEQPRPTWPDREVVDLLQDFGDQVEITVEFPRGAATFYARPRTRPSLREDGGLRADPIAEAATPAGLRIALMEAGYAPWE